MMLGEGLLGLFVTIILIFIIYILIKTVIDKAPKIEPDTKAIINWVWLALCIIWVCYLLAGQLGYATPLRIGHH